MITINDILEKVKEKPKEEKDLILKAYEIAEKEHKGQLRQSGEPYIIHPLSAADNLLFMGVTDTNSLCAALLHDTLEDTELEWSDIKEEINEDVANLVAGVTKLGKNLIPDKKLRTAINSRNFINYVATVDIRILLIKLADNMHNVSTLEHKSPIKQKENALETLEFYVPLAEQLGFNKVKTCLENKALSFIDPDGYKRVEEHRIRLEEDATPTLKEMLEKVHYALNDRNIPNEVRYRIKSIYGIYREMQKGESLNDIHDLLALKVVTDTIDECYAALGVVHNQIGCKPYNGMFKDYIAAPKTNGYQSLHTTIFTPDERLIQTQIATKEMTQKNRYGVAGELTTPENIQKVNERLRQQYPIVRAVIELNHTYQDNQEYIEQLKNTLLSEKIYVYSPDGIIRELPKGATPIDYAYSINAKLGHAAIGAIVNEKQVPAEYELQNLDRVRILTNDKEAQTTRKELEDSATTTKAKRKIKTLHSEQPVV